MIVRKQLNKGGVLNRFDADEVVRLRASLGRIARLLDRQGYRGDLTRTQIEILGSIANRSPISARELGEHVSVNPTMLSRVLSKLEAAALVRRSADSVDRRAVWVTATPSGAELAAEVRAERTRLLGECVDLLAGEEADRLLGALGALEQLAQAMARTEAR